MKLRILSFKTKAEALEYLRSVKVLEESARHPGVFYRGGVYYLNHGEYARPVYSVRRYKDGWGIHVKHFYYYGTLYVPSDGRLYYCPWEYEG